VKPECHPAPRRAAHERNAHSNYQVQTRPSDLPDQFGPFQLDAAEHRLLRQGVEVPVQLKAFETLCILVENAGRLLKKEDLEVSEFGDVNSAARPQDRTDVAHFFAAVNERLFGCQPYPITLSSPGIPTIVLHYTKLGKITDDIDDARVYGGIHFRYDQEAGGRQGQRIGSFVFSHKLQPASGSGQGEDQDQDGCSE